jgi:hypothetical protein
MLVACRLAGLSALGATLCGRQMTCNAGRASAMSWPSAGTPADSRSPCAQARERQSGRIHVSPGPFKPSVTWRRRIREQDQRARRAPDLAGPRRGQPPVRHARARRELQRRHSPAGRRRWKRRMRAVASLMIAAGLVQSSGALGAEALACSTWQQITTCSSPDGYLSHESTWQGLTTGQDNAGDLWSTSRWQGIETTTVEPPDR